MWNYFRRTFFEPRDKQWFRAGLVIESASEQVADAGVAKLASAFPGVRFNLLSRVARPGFGDVCQVKRRLGGLRLILAARRHYDLVILFGTGEPRLRLCRACALLLMRPVRFFVFNEFGEGFWLNRENSRACREHLFRRLDIQGKREYCRRRWEKIAPVLERVWRPLCWSAGLVPRFLKICSAGVLFTVALFCLALLRLMYDSRKYRFRFAGKRLSAPRRELHVAGVNVPVSVDS